MNKKVLVPAVAVVFLAMLVVTPVSASTVIKLPTNFYGYLIGFTPGKTWTSKNGQVIYGSGASSTFICWSSIGTGILVSTNVYSEFNLVTGKGWAVGRWVWTITDGPWGSGTLKGMTTGKTTSPENLWGTLISLGSGKLEYCKCVTWTAKGAWYPIYEDGNIVTIYTYDICGTVTLYG